MKVVRRHWSIASLTLCAMLFALCLLAHAQQTEKIFRVGYLEGSTASGSAVLVDAFRQELSKLGWIEGKNISVDYRFADGKRERLPELTADLVRLKVDLIVVTGVQPALAAKKATTSIPIVFTSAPDPVGLSLVASLARPGGNITGVASLSTQLNTKRLEVLKDTVLQLSRVGVLKPEGRVSKGAVLQLKEIKTAALSLNLKLEELETRLDANGLENAFQTAKQTKIRRNHDDNRETFFI